MLPGATKVLHPLFWVTVGDSAAKWHNVKYCNFLRKVKGLEIMWHKS